MIATQSHVNEFWEGPHHSTCHVANPIIIYDWSWAAFPQRPGKTHMCAVTALLCLCVRALVCRRETEREFDRSYLHAEQEGARLSVLSAGEWRLKDGDDCTQADGKMMEQWPTNLLTSFFFFLFSALSGFSSFCKHRYTQSEQTNKSRDVSKQKPLQCTDNGGDHCGSLCLFTLIFFMSGPVWRAARFWALQYLAFFMVAQTCHNTATYIHCCQTCQLSKP